MFPYKEIVFQYGFAIIQMYMRVLKSSDLRNAILVALQLCIMINYALQKCHHNIYNKN